MAGLALATRRARSCCSIGISSPTTTPTTSPATSDRGRSGCTASVAGRLYPKPDLVIYLDAPGAVLLARKGEGASTPSSGGETSTARSRGTSATSSRWMRPARSTRSPSASPRDRRPLARGDGPSAMADPDASSSPTPARQRGGLHPVPRPARLARDGRRFRPGERRLPALHADRLLVSPPLGRDPDAVVDAIDRAVTRDRRRPRDPGHRRGGLPLADARATFAGRTVLALPERTALAATHDKGRPSRWPGGSVCPSADRVVRPGDDPLGGSLRSRLPGRREARLVAAVPR